MKTHYTIPFFIPHEGCPFTCIFCSQKKISGRLPGITPADIKGGITERLKTIPRSGTWRETAFFGGSFTAIPMEKQEEYLRAVWPFIRRGAINAIRVSTRPDFIDDERLDLLKRYGVETIELGVQSLDDCVLLRACRGHPAGDVRRASRLIIKRGFTLGHQLMVGLPGSTAEIEMKSARMSCLMGAAEARIYPVVVIRGTALAGMWKNGAYKPLTGRTAIERSAKLVDIFKKRDVTILRVGLHPSRDLLSGSAVLAGPFHEAFGQKVDTYRCGKLLADFMRLPGSRTITHVRFNPADAGSVIGYGRANARRVESAVKRRSVFVFDNAVPEGSIFAELAGGARKLIGRF